jgi:hypothetical protein
MARKLKNTQASKQNKQASKTSSVALSSPLHSSALPLQPLLSYTDLMKLVKTEGAFVCGGGIGLFFLGHSLVLFFRLLRAMDGFSFLGRFL